MVLNERWEDARLGIVSASEDLRVVTGLGAREDIADIIEWMER